MNSDGEADNTIYKVVFSHEAQYSIWPADREYPVGWKAECLGYIKEVWTDMRPLSLRKKLSETERSCRTTKA